MKTFLTILVLILLPILVYFLYRRYIEKLKTIFHLPLQELGLHSIPAVPFSIIAIIETAKSLLTRDHETVQAKSGFQEEFKIDGHSDNAYSFLFGKSGNGDRKEALQELDSELKGSVHLKYRNHTHLKNKLLNEEENISQEDEKITQLSLEKAEDYRISWTGYNNINKNGKPDLKTWATTLTDAKEAIKQFFPIIAKYGAAYNLLILQKVDDSNVKEYKKAFEGFWTPRMDELKKKGNLYVIDLRIYQMLKPQEAKGRERFTPATFTWLEMKEKEGEKQILPFAVYVSGHEGENQMFYDFEKVEEPYILYALQAVKTSVTVFGIWLGHVYHWHIVTASMVMTMDNNIPEDHFISQLFASNKKDLIGFNATLFLRWKAIGPPTSITSTWQFLELTNRYAEGRKFFDDDPINTLTKLGLIKSDKDGSLKTKEEDLDWYPIAGFYLEVWSAVEKYIHKIVDHKYPNDQDVKNDTALAAWIKSSGDKHGGNIKGLPEMDSTNALKKVLTSFFYRIVIHGISRMQNSLGNALTFIPNFPPCLQKSTIPQPVTGTGTGELKKDDLFSYLPNTGTIGGMINFYYIFVFSAPNDPFIPTTGDDANLIFDDGNPNSIYNQALIDLRGDLRKFIERYTKEDKMFQNIVENPQYSQWPSAIST